MTKLTEDMIIARTKSSDLGAVKKLNCWGSDLDDINLVKRLSNVEVLSLSLNKITSLADFQYCRNLVELYIRRNSIRDLSELCYLQDLPRLRRLLLAENPCVETAGAAYRATVIRCLPLLEVLDNNEVSAEEVEHAMKSGLILEHPMARRERVSPEPTYYREESPPAQQIVNHAPPMGRRNSTAVEYEEAFRNSTALSRSPPSEYSTYMVQREERRSPAEETVPLTNGIPPSNGMVAFNHSQSVNSVNTNGHNRLSSANSSSSVIDEGPSPTNNNINSNEIPVSRRVQRSPVQDYYQQQQRESSERSEMTNGGGYQQRRGSVDYVQENPRTYQESYYDDSPPPQPRNSGQILTQSSRIVNNIQSRPKPRSKPTNGTRFMEQNPAGPRSSNLLSAVLCLIPELDWASLEVVELAIRRRMDELLSD